MTPECSFCFETTTLKTARGCATEASTKPRKLSDAPSCRIRGLRQPWTTRAEPFQG